MVVLICQNRSAEKLLELIVKPEVTKLRKVHNLIDDKKLVQKANGIFQFFITRS